MSELMTTKEVQDLLNVDRITVYRMVKDGRLTGIKVGQQWRFSRKELDNMLSGFPEEDTRPMRAGDVLPVHCLQVIQDVFAEILDVGSVTTDTDGQPLSDISNSCEFCNLILQSPEGRSGCVASWKKLARLPAGDPEFMKCHAGLQYARGRIDIQGEQIALLIAGQFYQNAPDEAEERARINSLAEKYGIDSEQLVEAAGTIRRLGEDREAQIGAWLIKVAQTFEDIGRERGMLLSRLKQIAEMSSLETIQVM